MVSEMYLQSELVLEKVKDKVRIKKCFVLCFHHHAPLYLGDSHVTR